jgi:hypothetical protein
MDRTPRNLVVLALVAAFALLYLANRDPRVGELNALLEAAPRLAEYPYQFRVLELDDGTAVMSTPRSPEVPVSRFLHAAFPRLRNLPVTDPAMMQAQQQLAERQGEAAALVRGHADVSDVRWELDRRWLQTHGVEMP